MLSGLTSPQQSAKVSTSTGCTVSVGSGAGNSALSEDGDDQNEKGCGQSAVAQVTEIH